MIVKIEDGCIGCGMCASICSTVFRMTDSGTAEVYSQPSTTEEADAQSAAESCPVSVILVE